MDGTDGQDRDRSGDVPAAYRGRHLEQALAEDPAVSELGVRVSVQHGRAHLTGEVQTVERRERVGAVVARLAPDLEVLNDVSVTAADRTTGEPGEPEVLA
jgi:osmotically-inducible protein OsmY